MKELTDDQVADLVEAGWTPPIDLWLSPTEANPGEVVLVCLSEGGDPEGFIIDFAYLGRDGGFFDAHDEDIEQRTGMRVVSIVPAPWDRRDEDAGFSVDARRLLWKFCSEDRAEQIAAARDRLATK